MAKQITIEGIPDAFYHQISARAARGNRSVPEFIIAEPERIVARPSVADWLQEVRRRKEASGISVSVSEILAARDADRRCPLLLTPPPGVIPGDVRYAAIAEPPGCPLRDGLAAGPPLGPICQIIVPRWRWTIKNVAGLAVHLAGGDCAMVLLSTVAFHFRWFDVPVIPAQAGIQQCYPDPDCVVATGLRPNHLKRNATYRAPRLWRSSNTPEWQNKLYRAHRYPPDYPGLQGLDLTPKGTVARYR